MKQFLKLSFFLALLLALSCLGQNEIPDDISAKIDELIQTTNIQRHIPAFGLAITKGVAGEEGSFEYAKGFGFRDLKNDVPADEETLFGIGSITKVLVW